MVRKIFLVSPREPSGVTWLINCFLELGIMTYRNSCESMWENVNGEFILRSSEESLKKWIPILSRKSEFTFRKDIEVQWTHNWPREEFMDKQIIYFVRDPRDAIYSGYKRLKANVSFKEYVYNIDPFVFLDRIDTWILFNKCWLEHKKIEFFKFEDYKDNSKLTLEKVLNYLDIDFDEKFINKVIENSTYEEARKAEEDYLIKHLDDKIKINLSGKVGYWKNNIIDADIIHDIEYRAADLMKQFECATSYRGNLKENMDNKNYKLLNNSSLYLSLIKKRNDQIDYGLSWYLKDINDEKIVVSDNLLASLKSIMDINNKLIIAKKVYELFGEKIFMKNANILIFGASNYGKLAYNFIKNINIELGCNINIKYFLDNDKKKYEKEIFNIKIKKPDKKLIEQVDYLIVASEWKLDIVNQLVEMGINKNKIIDLHK